MRLAAAVEYAGDQAHGWQRQEHARSIQGDVEAALSSVAAEPVAVMAAGRTDAGVHATEQIIHFDTAASRREHGWVLGANVHLPAHINLLWVHAVSGDFHARFSATARRYRYLILNRRARTALFDRRVCWFHHRLDEAAMQAASAALLGEHDFSAFRAAECQSRTPFRNIHWLRVWRRGDWVGIDVEANAFLHHMVRNIAGTLMAVGCGRYPPEWVESVLESRDRREAGATAPAEGLYLVGVTYPERFALPATEPLWPF